jgi:hypothetical protein
MFLQPPETEQLRVEEISPVFYYQWLPAYDNVQEDKLFEVLNRVPSKHLTRESGDIVKIGGVLNQGAQIKIWRYGNELRLWVGCRRHSCGHE